MFVTSASQSNDSMTQHDVLPAHPIMTDRLSTLSVMSDEVWDKDVGTLDC